MFWKKKAKRPQGEEKTFEDRFFELQTDMVSVCLAYVDGMADEIYIYCYCENKVLSFDVFYRVQGQVVKKHKLNDAAPGYDTSTDTQWQVLETGKDNLLGLYSLCREAGRDMPTELKLVYKVKENSFDAHYNYGSVLADDPARTPSDLLDGWFEEISRG